MKPVAMFVLGAVLAGGAAFFIAGRNPEPKPVTQVTSELSPPAAAPAAAPAVEPAPAPEPVDTAKSSPFAADSRPVPKPARRIEPREPRRSEPRSQPQVVAKNDPPAPAPSAPVVTNPTPSAPAKEPAAVEPIPQPSILDQQRLPPPPARKPNFVTIPAGTLVTVRLDQTLSSEQSQAGDTFRATLDAPLIVDGLVIAERGARAEGKVSKVDQSGRVRGLAELALVLTSVRSSDGQTIRFDTDSFVRQAENSKKEDAAKVGAAAGIGAAIGAIAGGGKGAAIGAAIGGASGAGGVMATRGKAAEIRAETRLSFKLSNPVTVTEKLK